MRANVNQNTDTVGWRPGPADRKNNMDLSHDHKTTFSMGELVPFYVEQTLPGDFFRIRTEVMLRFAPLYLPIMHRVNLAIDYFFVPLRVLWPGYLTDGWEAFITGQQSLVVPYTAIVIPSGLTPYADDTQLHEYMGFPSKLVDSGADILLYYIPAFMHSAYVRIWDEWYRNEQIQDKRWFPLVQGANTTAFNAIVPSPLSTGPYRRNWNRDMYTSLTPLPQSGEDVKIPMIDDNLTLPAPSIIKNATTGALIDMTGALTSNASGEAMDSVTTTKVFVDNTNIAATIRQLRFATMLTEFLELEMRAGDNYPDHNIMYWGVNPDPLKIDRPKFIGGKRGRVVVSDVLSTAETATLKVGSYAGQAMALESSDTISYLCFDYGVVMGIISVYPQSSYFQGIPNHFLMNERFDWPFPQFALIGDEPVQNREVRLAFENSKVAYNAEIFGYGERYRNWRYRNDIISGKMRDQYVSFHLGRIIDPTVDFNLDSDFIECNPRVSDVFQVEEGEHEIFAHIYNEVYVDRSLPKYGIPKL